MAQPPGDGADVYVLTDQQCGGCVPEAVKGDVRQLTPILWNAGVVSVDNVLKYIVRCGRIHLPPVPLNEDIVIPLPLAPDGQPVLKLILAIGFDQLDHGGRNRDRADGGLILWRFGHGLTFHQGGAFSDAHGSDLQVDIISFQGDQFPAA